MMKQVAMYGAAVMTTLLALVVLWQFHVVVVYVLISLTLAATLRPLVLHLVGRKLAVRAAWILLYLAVLGSFGFLLFFAGETSVKEIQHMGRMVAAQDAWKMPVWLEGSSFHQGLTARLPPPSKIFEALTGSQGQLVLPAIMSFSQDIGGIMSGAILILLLSIYWSISQVHFERLWLSLLPSGQRKQARGVWRTIEPDIGAYIRGQVIQSVLTGILLGLGYWLLGSPYPAILALAGALACLIPVVGAAIAASLPLFVGLLTSVPLSLITFFYTLVILIALAIWVKPRLFSRRWDNPILTVILLIVLADAFGLLGLIIAPPVSVICQILWRRLVTHPHALGASAQISDLKERQEHIRAIIQEMDEPHPPLVTSSMERLSQLIQKSESILEAPLPAKSSEHVFANVPQPGPIKPNGGS